MLPVDDDEAVWYWREFEMVDERVLVIVYGLMDGSFKMLLRGTGMGCQTDGLCSGRRGWSMAAMSSRCSGAGGGG